MRLSKYVEDTLTFPKLVWPENKDLDMEELNVACCESKDDEGVGGSVRGGTLSFIPGSGIEPMTGFAGQL